VYPACRAAQARRVIAGDLRGAECAGRQVKKKSPN